MGEKVERRGRKLTPGERFKNWVDSILKLWPVVTPLLLGTVYGNSETVKELIHRAPPTIEDIQPVSDGHYDKSINDIITKIRALESEMRKVKSNSSGGDTGLRSHVNSADSDLQAQIDEIKKLVQ